MNRSVHRHFRAFSITAAMVLAAGSAAPAAAGPPPRGPETSVRFNGIPIRTTSARIANQRTITFRDSARALILWDEYAAGARTSWFALSLDGNRVDQVQSTEGIIRLRYASFDPLAGLPAVPQALRAPADNELFMVQFVATPLDEMRRDVAALGGVVERFLPDNTHIVRMSAATRAAVSDLPYVRWVGAYETAYRLSDEVRADILEAGPDAAAVRYSIECMRDGPAQQNAIAELVTTLKGIVDTTIPDQHRLEATLTPAQALAVAGRNEISFMDPSGVPYGSDMDIVRQIGGASTILAPAGFTGQGVRGELFDGGLLTNHQQWNGQVPLARGTASIDSHGTACYGINFATGTGNAIATGLCPSREQGMYERYQDTNQAGLGTGTTPRLTFNMGAVDPNGNFRSCYQFSSVGSPQITTYSTVSQEVDDYLFKIDYLSCQSQSNTGNMTSRPQAWAKNIFSVGGVTHANTLTRADDSWTSASFGPAQDGRIKPDISHFYDNVTTTYTTSTTGYGTFSGTSCATPCTAGHCGLVMQLWHESAWPGFGGGSTVFSDRPYSTTVKALVVASAYRYFWVAPTPPISTSEPIRSTLTRVKQGWGMPDVGKLYGLRNKTFIVNADQPVQNAQTRTYQLSIASGEPELLVTMCYIDPAPATTANPNRVNDLSLRVTAPDNTQYWGNNGLSAGNFSTPGGVANTADTIENVFLQNPAAGIWTIEVIGSQVVVDAYPTGSAGVVPTGPTDAAFSLVVLGAVPAPAPGCYVNCDGSTTAPCVNVLDFSCFLNRFAAGDTYTNCDNSTIPPVLNVLDFSCYLNLFAAGCSNC